MSYKIEDVNGCTKKLVFNFESVDLSTQINEALKEKQKTVNLKGFRKGKAPLPMVQKLYGPQVENDALYRFISNEFFNAVQAEKIQAVGYPKFEKTKYEADKKSVEFEATVETMPVVELKNYKGFTFTAEPTEVTDEDYQKIEDQLLSSKATTEAVKNDDQALENGLFAVFNFEGEKEDGEKPENMKGKEFLLEIGSGQFIPGFEEKMIGLKKGEKKTLDLTFPENYHAEDLKGANVKFHVELLEIKEKKKPELTDELVKEYGYDTVALFKEKSLENLKTQKKRSSTEKLHQDILNKLIEENKFDVPNTMIAQQRVAVEDELKQNLQAQGFTDDMAKTYFNKWGEQLNEKAEFQVRSGLLLNELAKKYEVEATEEDFEKKLDEITSSGQLTKEQVNNFYRDNEKMKNNIMYAIREEKTFEELKKEFTIS